jgi:hypothetical protein
MTTRARGSNASVFSVNGLGGGLNRAVSSFKLKDDEMRDCKNVRFVLAGSIQPREGLRNYDISGAHLTGANVAAKKMWRYIRSDNVVKLVVQFTDGNVYVDTNDGVFTSAGTVPYSSDSGTRFTQWRDSLFAVGTNGIPYLYNTDQAATFQASTSSGAMSAGVASPFVGAMLGTGAEGSWIDGNSYSYRFTLDYYMGNDFLGESSAAWNNCGSKRTFVQWNHKIQRSVLETRFGCKR